MNLKIFAIIFGIVFIIVGILGFIPSVTPNGKLLGIFMVDPLHNSVHLVSGIIALVAAIRESYAEIYFKVFGIIYAIVTILGFILMGNLVLMQMNMADNFLHLVIAVVALYLGFVFKAQETEI